MAHFKIYIKPFDEKGDYTEFRDVTEYVDKGSFSSISQSIDNADYNVGVFRFSSFNIGVNNQKGLFSEAESGGSMFLFKRADSIVKVTYQIDETPYAGIAIAGSAKIAPEVEVFQGLLNDESAATRIDQQVLNFQVLGLESILSRQVVPFEDISNGDLFSELIYASLNQDMITKVLNVSMENIQVGTDVAIDVKDELADKTVKEALDDLLLMSNSVLYVKDATIYVAPRTSGETVLQTFYGQSSNSGIENIIDLHDIRSGMNKTFNYWKWEDTSVVRRNVSSITVNGVRRKDDVSFAYITESTKQGVILDNLLEEFQLPKTELKIVVPLNYENLELGFLDRVAIDYPPVALSAEGDIPVYGISKYAESIYPISLFSLTLDAQFDQFKIMGIRIDTKFFNIEFSLRRV